MTITFLCYLKYLYIIDRQVPQICGTTHPLNNDASRGVTFMRRKLLIITGLLTVGSALHLPAAAQQVYEGVCDASAAIAVDAIHFLVAEDENDVLWIYRNDKPRNKPRTRIKIPGFLLSFCSFMCMQPNV